MNAHYDTHAAAQSIGILMHETLEGDQNEIMHLSDVQTVSYDACAVQEPKSYRLTEKNSEEFFEATFRIRGILCQNNLPPILEIRPGIPGHRLRQSVTLTALGNHAIFEKYLTAIRLFSNLFQATFPGEKFALDAFQTYEGHPCIVAFNRYLSFRSDTPNMRQIPFDHDVDPYSLLRNHPYQNMHHVEENRVLYSRRVMVDGKQSLIREIPASFKNGDMVEIHFSFVAFPMKRNEPRRIGCIMQHLIMLSDNLRLESEGRFSLPTPTVKVRRLKRKHVPIYDDDDPKSKHMRL